MQPPEHHSAPGALSDARFTDLCERHLRALRAYLLCSCGDLDLADEIAQQTLIAATDRRQEVERDADFPAWLLALAHDLWTTERNRRQLDDRLTPATHQLAADIFRAERFGEERYSDERRLLRDCLGRLGEEDRQLVEYVLHGPHSYQDAATRFDRGVSWVRNRHARLRQQLRDGVARAMRKGHDV